jgi:uncharacterized GH25 family protein
LFAHYTWLSPAPGTVKAGSPVTVLLANGHAFPAAEAPLQGIAIKMKAVDPTGRATALTVADRGRGPEAVFPTGAEGLYRVAGEYDRGVISRTPEGWKPGGRKDHPEATSTIKSYNSFLCAVRTAGAALKSAEPLGLAFEISWARDGRAITVLATASGRPVAGAAIAAIIGSGEVKPAGQTNAAGRAEVLVPEGFKGPILLTGSISRPAPAGAGYEEERSSSSYFLNWD